MFIRFKIIVACFGLLIIISSCRTSTNSPEQTTGQVQEQKVNPTEYQEFAGKFVAHVLPFSVPGDIDNKSDLDKKFIRDMLSATFTPAFGGEDILPSISDNIDNSKYFAGPKLKIDSFNAYVIHKQGEDDYYFLCLFDKNGRFTDGTWIAFTEGSDDDGTIRQASINKDGSIEISQYNVLKGKPDRTSSERHFYEITSQGKIRDLKENANPANS
jgi:hypothetical protein